MFTAQIRANGLVFIKSPPPQKKKLKKSNDEKTIRNHDKYFQSEHYLIFQAEEMKYEYKLSRMCSQGLSLRTYHLLAQLRTKGCEVKMFFFFGSFLKVEKINLTSSWQRQLKMYSIIFWCLVLFYTIQNVSLWVLTIEQLIQCIVILMKDNVFIFQWRNQFFIKKSHSRNSTFRKLQLKQIFFFLFNNYLFSLVFNNSFRKIFGCARIFSGGAVAHPPPLVPPLLSPHFTDDVSSFFYRLTMVPTLNLTLKVLM